MKFTNFDLSDEMLDAIYDMGFDEATEIQEKAIPIITEGKDLIGCAQTGTGKTAAFLVPVIDRLAAMPGGETTTLIIVPTRELAIQIDQQVQGLAYPLHVTSIAIYGGGDGDNWGQQKTALTAGADIIVATPGKLISHLNLGYVKFDKIKYLIMDEADRMLDIGFHDDIIKIISYLPKDRQTLMFSATMPPKIRTFAEKILKNPEEITLAMSKPAEGVLQASYLTYEKSKIALINQLISDKPEYKSILIFSSTKKKVSEIVKSLKKARFNAAAISSDLEQSEREEVLLQFRAKNTRILVATDVLSRGIDIKDINLVINFDVPGDAEDYVHRVGRTARAETTGVALTFITPDDMDNFAKIEKLIEREIIKIPTPENIGETPEWKVGNFANKRKFGGKKNFRKGGSKKGGKKHFGGKPRSN